MTDSTLQQPRSPTHTYIGRHKGSTVAERTTVGRKEVKGGKTRDQEKFCLSAQPGSCLMTLQLHNQI